MKGACHLLAGTIKDVVCRYAHQTGHHVERRLGWDCHGLPIGRSTYGRLVRCSRANHVGEGNAARALPENCP